MPCADERMNPVYDYQVNPCGPVYLNVGDGGNIGEFATGAAPRYAQPHLCLASPFCHALISLHAQRVCTKSTSTIPASARIRSPASASPKWYACRLHAALHQSSSACHRLHTAPVTAHILQQGAMTTEPLLMAVCSADRTVTIARKASPNGQPTGRPASGTALSTL